MKTITQLDKLKKTVEILPIFLGFLIFCGFLKLHFLYQNWNVDILVYLDFSEILLSFFNDLYLFLSIILICLLNVLIGRQFVKHTRALDRRIEKLDEMRGKQSVFKFEKNIPVMKKIMTVVGLVLTTCFIAIFLNDYNSTWLVLGTVIGFESILYIFEFLVKTTDYIRMLITSSIVFACFTWIVSESDCNVIRQNAKTDINIIITSEDTLTTDTNYFLIGKTQNFLFLHDTKQNRTDVLKMETIKRISTTKTKLKLENWLR